jgi:hypothetical protein
MPAAITAPEEGVAPYGAAPESLAARTDDAADDLFDEPTVDHPRLAAAFTAATGFSRSRALAEAATDFGTILDRIRRHQQVGPIVLRNVAADWPALRKWDRGHLLSRYGDRRVDAALRLPRIPFLAPEHAVRRAMTLRSFWDEMDRADRCYLEQQVLSEFPGLEDDLRIGELLGRDSRPQPNLWIGRATKSGLHFDPADNVLIMIRGSKLVAMAAPDEIGRLYPLLDSVMKSPVDVERPDFTRFPRAGRVEMHVGVLTAGDLLFIPAGWWHHVSSATADYHLSVNCWFGEDLPLSRMAKDLVRLGPRYVTQLAADFVVRGLLRRPFVERFHALPDGVKLYRKLTGQLHPRGADPRRRP